MRLTETDAQDGGVVFYRPGCYPVASYLDLVSDRQPAGARAMGVGLASRKSP